MMTSELHLINDFAEWKSVVAANYRVTPVSLAQILRETAGAISGRAMWVMELLAVAGLVFCLSLMSAVGGGLEALALDIAAMYFSLSAALGAYLLWLDWTRERVSEAA